MLNTKEDKVGNRAELMSESRMKWEKKNKRKKSQGR